jgi:cation/acetate symporter
MASAWLRRNVRQVCDGGPWRRIIYETTLFPYDNPALFSMTIAFVGIWLFSKVDATARARAEQSAFEAQYVRSETGIGAAGALAH